MLIAICNPVMVVIDVVVVVPMVVVVVVVVVHPLMVVVVMLVVLINLSRGSGFGKNRFVRLVARFESLCSVDQSVELYVGEPLGLFGHPVLDNVDVLHRPKRLKVGLQLILGDIFADNNKEPEQSFLLIGLPTAALVFSMGYHYLRGKLSRFLSNKAADIPSEV